MIIRPGFNYRWGLHWLLPILLVASLGARLWLTCFRYLNADEFQHLHSSWMVHLGYLPYRDFWENHGPLLYFFLAPLLGFFGEGTQAVLVARLIVSAIGLVILLLTYVLASTAFDRLTGFLAVLILSYAEIFLQKTIEVRTDPFLIVCWMITLWMLLQALLMEQKKMLYFAGAMLGIGMLFSPKALICLPAGCILLISFRGKTPNLRATVTRQFLFVGGFLTVVAAFSIPLLSMGIFHSWLGSTVLDNLTYPDTRGPDFLLRPQNLGLLLLGVTGMLLSMRSGNPNEKAARILIVPALLPLIVLIFLMPSTFSQSGLLFLPLFAIYAGFAMKKVFEWRPSQRFVASVVRTVAILCALLMPLFSFVSRVSREPSNREQMDLIQQLMKQTSRSETIFDGNCAYIFRKQAYYYGSLVEGIRHKLKQGQIYENIADSLRKNRCRVVLYDDRVSDLPSATQDFLRTNYLPSENEKVWIAGKELGPQDLSQNRAVFRIEIAGVYSINTVGGKNLRIGSRPYKEALFLKAGVYELLSEHHLRKVILRAVR